MGHEYYLETLSSTLGWIYMLSWGLSFYPQLIHNWQRQSTKGFAIEFAALNVLGFACYTISTTLFLFSSVIRRQYAARHPLSPEPTTRYNDLAFGMHAVVVTALTYSQFWPSLWRFQNATTQHVNRIVVGIIGACFLSVATVLLIVIAKQGPNEQNPGDWAWIDLVYTFGYIKLILTLVKYVPQVRTNHVLRSTLGWSIMVTIFDVTGGVLSILQLVIDASLQGDWSGITGNPLKFGLACITLFFDVVLIIQHFVLYRDSSDSNDPKDTERRSLLHSD